MSLKEITKDKHTEAERTPFMRAVIKGEIPKDIWADYTHNKGLWYQAIETKARAEGLLDDLPDLERTHKLYQDYMEMTGGEFKHHYHAAAIDYHRYILDLEPGKVAAHLYVWHMGDLFGGQMIKKILNYVPHRSLEFKDVDTLKATIRTKLGDDLGEEAKIAFDWAIKIMDTYNNELGLGQSQ